MSIHPTTVSINQGSIRTPFARPTSPGAYLTIGRYDPATITQDLALRLMTYCETHDLVFTSELQEAFLAQNATGVWIIVVKCSGFLRICARTGLWLPGEIRHYEVGKSRYCEASCYTRYSVDDRQWVRVAASARFDNFYDRDLNNPDYLTPDVLGDWALIPDIKLGEVAQVQAARSALRDLVAEHITFYQNPRNILHASLLEARGGLL